MDEQNEQSLSYNADNSLNSKETDVTLSSNGNSFENQKQTSRNLKSHIISAIAANLITNSSNKIRNISYKNYTRNNYH